MGTLVGHVAPGFGFFVIGVWHLFNHIMLYARAPSSYSSLPWFPAPRLRHLELYLIMLGSYLSIAMELFIGPNRHQPLDTDGTIPSNHLHNFEHSLISLSFFVYAAFALLFDRLTSGGRDKTLPGTTVFGLTQLVGAVAFGQQLLLFHLHSADHMGVEGQYHLLLQLVIFVSLATTLIGIPLPRSFLVSFVRSASIMFQGIWLMIMGFMLWTPGLIPKGCFMNLEEGHLVVRCRSDEALHRAKSLVNIEFSWFLVCVTVFSVSVYLVLARIYGKDSFEYEAIHSESDDIELQKSNTTTKPALQDDGPSSKRFIHDVGKISGYSAGSDMER